MEGRAAWLDALNQETVSLTAAQRERGGSGKQIQKQVIDSSRAFGVRRSKGGTSMDLRSSRLFIAGPDEG